MQIRYLPHHPNVCRRLGRLNKKSLFASLSILQECCTLLKKHNIQVSPVSSSCNHIQYLGRIPLKVYLQRVLGAMGPFRNPTKNSQNEDSHATTSSHIFC